jgi:hypothetical protein
MTDLELAIDIREKFNENTDDMVTRWLNEPYEDDV